MGVGPGRGVFSLHLGRHQAGPGGPGVRLRRRAAGHAGVLRRVGQPRQLSAGRFQVRGAVRGVPQEFLHLRDLLHDHPEGPDLRARADEGDAYHVQLGDLPECAQQDLQRPRAGLRVARRAEHGVDDRAGRDAVFRGLGDPPIKFALRPDRQFPRLLPHLRKQPEDAFPDAGGLHDRVGRWRGPRIGGEVSVGGQRRARMAGYPLAPLGASIRRHPRDDVQPPD
mmetsp:Transcript_56681/g.161531  ORF Transcript_56681/g.161531 Transcript_56681/m.161531 type:complete len:224 (-) Transcript_56681:479-1150(-)